jgi:hypothetical protein
VFLASSSMARRNPMALIMGAMFIVFSAFLRVGGYCCFAARLVRSFLRGLVPGDIFRKQ